MVSIKSLKFRVFSVTILLLFLLVLSCNKDTVAIDTTSDTTENTDDTTDDSDSETTRGIQHL